MHRTFVACSAPLQPAPSAWRQECPVGSTSPPQQHTPAPLLSHRPLPSPLHLLEAQCPLRGSPILEVIHWKLPEAPVQTPYPHPRTIVPAGLPTCTQYQIRTKRNIGNFACGCQGCQLHHAYCQCIHSQQPHPKEISHCSMPVLTNNKVRKHVHDMSYTVVFLGVPASMSRLMFHCTRGAHLCTASSAAACSAAAPDSDR